MLQTAEQLLHESEKSPHIKESELYEPATTALRKLRARYDASEPTAKLKVDEARYSTPVDLLLSQTGGRRARR